VGARAGVNFSSITGKWNNEDTDKHKWIAGPVAGAVGGYSFTDMISLRAELLYLTMGEKTVYQEEGARGLQSEEYFFKERYNCLQMVIMAYFMWNIRAIILYANAGTFLTRKFGGKWWDPHGSRPIKWGQHTYKNGDNVYYVDPEYNRRIDFGTYIGGGIGKDLGPGRLELDLRFGFGLVDLNKFESKEQRQEARDNGYRPYRSLNFSISLAYLYLFSKN
jgi:hypothetical protein